MPWSVGVLQSGGWRRGISWEPGQEESEVEIGGLDVLNEEPRIWGQNSPKELCPELDGVVVCLTLWL